MRKKILFGLAILGLGIGAITIVINIQENEQEETMMVSTSVANLNFDDIIEHSDIIINDEIKNVNSLGQQNGNLSTTSNIDKEIVESESIQPTQVETEQSIQVEDLELTGTIIDGTIDFKNPTIMVEVLNFTYDVVCFELADYATEDWITKYASGTKVSITCLDDFDYTEEQAPHMATLVSIDVIEPSTQWKNSMQQNSLSENGKNSLAYLETIQDNISQAMLNKELPFVSSCTVDESLRVVKVGITEMKDEYIQKLKEYENMGPALDIFQQEFATAE